MARGVERRVLMADQPGAPTLAAPSPLAQPLLPPALLQPGPALPHPQAIAPLPPDGAHRGPQAPNGAVPGHTPNGTAAGVADHQQSMHQRGRNKIPWSPEVWDRIDQAVGTEVKRTRIGARFLPVKHVPPKTTSVPTDSYRVTGTVYGVDEGATIRLNEYYVEFELTPQQVAQEEGDFRDLGHSTAVTLATKAANTLALAEDLIIFQGQNAITGALPFTSGLVQILGGNKPVDTGLLNFEVGKNVPGKGPLTVPPAKPITEVTVAPIGVPGVIYGPATFEAVSSAYSQLQAAGQYGPYALVLETVPYADTFAPLPATLTLTADRIKPLVTAGYFGSGTLPPNPPPAPAAPYYGVLVSLGGNTMDLVVGSAPITAFLQEDTTGNFRFRVLQRFALRVKDPTAIVILKFT
jgi:uncharacterized linocin/CFP29 family protein